MVMPVLLTLLFGVMEFGWMMTKASQLTNAARDGARTAARADATDADVQAVVDARMSEAEMGSSGYATNITHGAASGDTVTVQITVAYDGNLELIGFPFIPLPGNLRAEVSMCKEGP